MRYWVAVLIIHMPMGANAIRVMHYMRTNWMKIIRSYMSTIIVGITTIAQTFRQMWHTTKTRRIVVGTCEVNIRIIAMKLIVPFSVRAQ